MAKGRTIKKVARQPEKTYIQIEQKDFDFCIAFLIQIRARGIKKKTEVDLVRALTPKMKLAINMFLFLGSFQAPYLNITYRAKMDKKLNRVSEYKLTL